MRMAAIYRAEWKKIVISQIEMSQYVIQVLVKGHEMKVKLEDQSMKVVEVSQEFKKTYLSKTEKELTN